MDTHDNLDSTTNEDCKPMHTLLSHNHKIVHFLALVTPSRDIQLS